MRDMISWGPLIYFLGFGAYLIASNLKKSVNKVLQSQNGWKYKCSGFSSSFLVAGRSSTGVWGKQASLTDRCVGEASAGVRGGLPPFHSTPPLTPVCGLPPGFLQSQSSLRLLLMLFPTLLLSIVIDISITECYPWCWYCFPCAAPCSHWRYSFSPQKQ